MAKKRGTLVQQLTHTALLRYCFYFRYPHFSLREHLMRTAILPQSIHATPNHPQHPAPSIIPYSLPYRSVVNKSSPSIHPPAAFLLITDSYYTHVNTVLLYNNLSPIIHSCGQTEIDDSRHGISEKNTGCKGTIASQISATRTATRSYETLCAVM